MQAKIKIKMENSELKTIKKQCLADIEKYFPILEPTLDSIDSRLSEYVISRTERYNESDCFASIYELLCIRKAFRLFFTYSFDAELARMWLATQEGVWKQDERGHWRHVTGGLKFDTPRGAQHVRLMPFQAWLTCIAMGFYKEVPLRQYKGEELLPSENVVCGKVYDRRRLCHEIHLYITRKAGKTEYGVSLDFAEFLIMGDQNAQVVIIGNSKDSAVGIAYQKAKQYAYQIDPKSVNKLGGNYLKVGANTMEFLPGFMRTSMMAAVAAGGKPKDGWNTEWVHADEHGQASYVNERSDMEATVQVFVGSGGVRRERMLLHTTTAGLVDNGPYKELLNRVHNMLLEEMKLPLGTPCKTSEDEWVAYLAELDPWDYDGTIDSLDHEHLFNRVNPAIGITVQPTWYKERLHEARTKNEDVLKEVLTKDFNIWQSKRILKWIQGEEIRTLQIQRTIEDCKAIDGWLVFTGLDFTNIGDDLQAQTYLAVRQNPETGKREFFADLDAWVTLEVVEHSPIRNLLLHFASLGYLHIIPGRVLSPNMPVDRCVELRTNHNVNLLGWGYDPARANDPINLLKNYLVTIGVKPSALPDYVMSVSQTFYTMTGLIDELTYLIRCETPLIRFSENPLWAWQFQNCMLVESSDGMENKKIVKSAQENKVDNVQALCNALYVFDMLNSKVNK